MKPRRPVTGGRGGVGFDFCTNVVVIIEIVSGAVRAKEQEFELEVPYAREILRGGEIDVCITGRGVYGGVTRFWFVS